MCLFNPNCLDAADRDAYRCCENFQNYLGLSKKKKNTRKDGIEKSKIQRNGYKEALSRASRTVVCFVQWLMEGRQDTKEEEAEVHLLWRATSPEEGFSIHRRHRLTNEEIIVAKTHTHTRTQRKQKMLHAREQDKLTHLPSSCTLHLGKTQTQLIL